MMRRLADEVVGDNPGRIDQPPPDLFAQVQAEAATTWRAPSVASAPCAAASACAPGTSALRSTPASALLNTIVSAAAVSLRRPPRVCTRSAGMDRHGRISYKLKRPWPDGRTHLVLPPVAFLRRLCGIIPPPRRHLVRYAGVFGPASNHRAALRALVPAGEPDDSDLANGSTAPSAGASRARRLPWAELLRRVFADDVLRCPCGGRRTVVAVVSVVAVARVVLVTLGLPTELATYTPARGPPQGDLVNDASA